MADQTRIPGAEKPWYRVNPRTALVLAAVLFALVTLFHWFDDTSGQAIVVLYVLPIALLAVACGRRGGLQAAVIGFGLFTILEIVHSSGDIDAIGWIVRALAMFLLGGLLGHATDRETASRQAAVDEQQRRCRVEEVNRRYAEAMEISDSLVQQMVAAKWMAEQGRSAETAEVLASTIADGERMVAGLLRQRMTSRAGRPATGAAAAAGPSWSAVAGLIEVLVVDDDPAVAESTAAVLRSSGLSVRVALSARDALTLCQGARFHAIVLDHHLGDGTCDLVFDRAADLPPAIVVSGATEIELDRLHRRHGDKVFAIRTKPCPPPDLIDIVRAAVAEHRG